MNVLTLRQEDLNKAVSDILTVCEQARGVERGGLPHFFYIKFEGLGNCLRLSANNLIRRIEIVISDGVSTHTPFCLGVAGVHLKNLVSSLPRGPVQLEIGKDLTVSSHLSSYSLKTLSPELFPVQDNPPPGTTLEVYDALNVFSRICFCSDKESSETYKKSVCITPDYIVSTDGMRLCFAPNVFLPTNVPILIPSESIKCFKGVFKGTHGGWAATDGYKIYLGADNTIVSTSLYEGKVPNFKSVMYQDSACTRVKLPGEEFRSVIRRVAMFTSVGRTNRETPSVFKFTNDNLTISINTDSYSATEEVPVENGIPVVMEHNILFIHEALENLKGDSIYLEIRGPELPVVMTDDDGFIKNIILPRRRT